MVYTSGCFGLLPDEGGAALPDIYGLRPCVSRMTLLHEIYDARRAYELGLITELVEDDLETRTFELLRSVGRGGGPSGRCAPPR